MKHNNLVSRLATTTTLVYAAAMLSSSSSIERVDNNTPSLLRFVDAAAAASKSPSSPPSAIKEAAESVLGMSSSSAGGGNAPTASNNDGGNSGSSGSGVVPPTPPDGSVKYGPAQLIGNKQNPKGLMTLIHGLGDSCYGWAPVAEELSQIHPDLLFFVPTAPTIPVTLNGGQPMPAWYDIVQMGGDVKNDPMMRKNIDWLIYQCWELCGKYNIPFDNVIYAGFSQGAALALHAGLSTPVAKPKGILMMSGRVRALDELEEKVKSSAAVKSVATSGEDAEKRKEPSSSASSLPPILMCHGTHDPVIPLQETAKGRQQMIDRGLVQESGIELKTYQYMQHSTSEEEMIDVSRFIQRLGFVSKI